MRKKIADARESLAMVGQLREDVDRLRSEVDALQVAVEESRRLNERLSDVLDVVVELLVPAVDRDEKRLSEALERL
jgi:hypothetical protein